MLSELLSSGSQGSSSFPAAGTSEIWFYHPRSTFASHLQGCTEQPGQVLLWELYSFLLNFKSPLLWTSHIQNSQNEHGVLLLLLLLLLLALALVSYYYIFQFHSGTPTLWSISLRFLLFSKKLQSIREKLVKNKHGTLFHTK